MKIPRYEQIPLKQLKKIVKKSYSMAEVFRKMGYYGGGRSKSFNIFLEKNNISIHHFKSRKPENLLKVKDLLIDNSPACRSSIKRYILKNNLLEYKCENCRRLPEWDGKPLTLILDHINGINNDHRLKNLRFLCPNCNSQTDTFSTKNLSKRYGDNNRSAFFSNREKLEEQAIIKKREDIIGILKNAKSLNDACLKLNCSYEKLKKDCKKFKLNYPKIKKKYKSGTLANKLKQLNDHMSEKDQLILLLKKYRSLSAIANVLGVSGNAIKKKCKKLEIDYNHYYLLEYQVKDMEKYYNTSKSLEQTAKFFKTSTHNISRIFKKYNICLNRNYKKNIAPDKIKKIEILLKSRKSIKYISDYLNISFSIVKKIKKDIGLTKSKFS
jgi:5-methylcytosine-specific restriction endonuclease McrA